MRYILCYLIPVLLLVASCDQKKTDQTGQPETKMPEPTFVPVKTTYRLMTAKDSIKNFKKYYSDAQQSILCAVNRADGEHIMTMDAVVVPADMQANIIQYSPFPPQVPSLRRVRKIIFFSYPAAYFGAYEQGQLIYSGPTNMGREKDKTPTGLFYTNWKAEETKSTFNDEWELKWNFNIENKEGVGWHQYAMPGFPASHSCLRLLEGDAKYLYDWADQWVMKGTDSIIAYGTPVIVFGAYPFGGPKPWLQLTTNPQAMNISVQMLEAEVSSHLDDIYAKQSKKDSLK